MDERVADRVQRIADMAGYTYEDTYDLIYADWDYPEEHLEWYANASDEEVANWVDGCLNGWADRVDE